MPRKNDNNSISKIRNDNKKEDEKKSTKKITNSKDNDKTLLKSGDWNLGKIFFGTSLVLIGLLYLLNNYGVFHLSNNFSIFDLWPLLIIFAGFSFINLKGWVGVLLSVLVGISLLGLIVAAAFWGSGNDLNKQSFNIPKNDSAKLAEINVDLGAAEVNVSGGSDVLTSGEFASNFRELVAATNLREETQTVDISTSGKGSFRFNSRNKLNLKLSESTPLNVFFKTGAVNMDMDFSSLVLKKLKIDTGATNLKLKLGDKTKNADVFIKAGASSINLKVPKDSGVRAEIDSGISSKNLDGLNKVEGNIYETTNYDDAKNKINLTVEIGVSSFDLSRY